MRQKRKWYAATIKDFRSSLYLSQVEFAKLIGVQQQTVSNWETGTTTPRGAHIMLLDRVQEEKGITVG